MVNIIAQRQGQRENKIRRICEMIQKAQAQEDKRCSYGYLVLYVKDIFMINDRTAKDYISVALFRLKLTKEDLAK